VVLVSEFIKCLQCGEPVLVDFQAFKKIICSNCSFEMKKKLLTWCKCSHAGINHADTVLEECRSCNCPNFLYVQDRFPDEYDEKLR